ncbi:MAG: lipopolysaccharide heptosyltransferase I, partial [Proteobacteria bacterium]|nr:lipopolysaccharide heptosyltransferase I [Pseudomonadota bacterium]
MKVLLVKTSSMGDVIHTLPAVTDAVSAIPGLRFDWVVEETFQEIPRWHKSVDTIFPIAIRRWRKRFFHSLFSEELHDFIKRLRENQYDMVIDAQGLLKSCVVACIAHGKRYGLDKQSIREPIASYFYRNKYSVSQSQHAIRRGRELFSKIFGYELSNATPDYGIQRNNIFVDLGEKPYVLFLHGTTWATKHWPESYWKLLIEKTTQLGIVVKLPWGNTQEFERATRLAEGMQNIEILPKKTLLELAQIISNAKAIIAMDTGLGHLAAALEVPTISLYGPTDPKLTGALGKSQI